MTTSAPNLHLIHAVRARSGRLLAAAGVLVAAMAVVLAIVLSQASGGGATVSDEPATGAHPDPAILHHHWLNTAEPDAAVRMREQAERFHHR